MAKGLSNKNEIMLADLRYGKNETSVPIPSHWTLYQEHLIAPFFVLQMFTSILFALDESIFYSMFGFVLLFVCEF
jgi:manganese-transporting P-type ATPase